MQRLSIVPRRILASLAATVLFVTLAPLSASAGHPPLIARADGIGTPTEMAMQTHVGATDGESFGSAVAVSGRWAVVGAPGHYAGSTPYVGSATAYRWSSSEGWLSAGDLPINDPGAEDWAGWAVAASPDELFVCAPNKRANGPDKMGGVIYVYGASDGGIALEQTLSVNATDTATQFGAAIAIDGATLVAGSPYASVGATRSGSVFVFRKDPAGWVQTQRIDPPMPLESQYFGNSVAIQGSDLVVGSPGWGEDDYGRVYTYRRNASGSWIGPGEQFLPSPADNDMFGASVGVSNGIMVATAPRRETPSGTNAGVAYVSRWTGTAWAQIADLESQSPSAEERFGQCAALSADTLLVSAAYGAGSGGATTGAVYHYTVDPLPVLPPTYRGVIYAATPGEPPSLDHFGGALAFDGDTMLAGAPAYNTATMAEVGAVWFFGGLRTARCRVDRILSVPMPGLLGNDGAPDSTMTASLESTPAHGIAAVNADGSWSYDPTSWFLGTDRFEYLVTSESATSAAVVTVEIYPPPTKVRTSITIKRSASSVRRRRAVKLYGRLSPGALGDHCVLYVKKPGSSRWLSLTTRHAYSITPNAGANWSCSYKPTRRGRYYFKVRYPGDAHRYSDWSPVVSVHVR